MKKTIIIWVLLSTLSIITMEAGAVQVYNLISGISSEKTSAKAPEINIEATDGCYTVTVNIEEVTFTEDDVYSGRFFLNLEGFGQTVESAQPSLPYHAELFYLPKNCYPSITIDECSYVDISKVITPARQPLPEDGSMYTQADIAQIAPYRGFSNNDLVSLDNILTYRGCDIMAVGLTPAQYAVTTNTIRIYNSQSPLKH